MQTCCEAGGSSGAKTDKVYKLRTWRRERVQLHREYVRMASRGKHIKVVVTNVTRELLSFIWQSHVERTLIAFCKLRIMPAVS